LTVLSHKNYVLADEELIEALSKIELLKREVLSKDLESDRVRREKEFLVERIKDLEGKISDLNNMAIEDEYDQENLKKQKDLLVARMKAMKEEKTFLLTEIEDLRDRLKDKELSFQEMISSETEPFEEKIRYLENNINDLKNIIRNKELKMKAIKVEKDQLRETLLKESDERKKLDLTVRASENKLILTEEEFVEKINEAKLPLQSQIFALEKKLESTSDEVLLKQSEINTTERELIKTRSQLKTLNEQRNSAEQQLFELERKLENSELSFKRESQKRIEKLNEKIDILQRKKNVLAEDVTLKGNIIGNLEDENSDLNKRVDAYQNENKNILAEIKKLKSEKINFQIRVDENIERVRDPLEKEISQLNNKIVKIERGFDKKIKSAKEPLMMEIAGLKEERSQLNEKVSDKEDLITKVQESRDAAVHDYAAVQKSKEKLEIELERAKVSLRSLEQDISVKVEKAKKALEKRNFKLEEDLEDVKAAHKMKIVEARSSLQDKIKELNEDKIVMEEKSKDSESIIETLNLYKRDLTKELNDLKKEKEKTEEMLAKVRSEVVDVKSSIQNKVQKAETPLKAKIQKLQDGLKFLDAEATVKIQEMESKLNVRINELENRLSEKNLLIKRNEENYKGLLREKKDAQRSLAALQGVEQKLEREKMISQDRFQKLESGIVARISKAEKPLKIELQKQKEKIVVLEESKKQAIVDTKANMGRDIEQLKQKLKNLGVQLEDKTKLLSDAQNRQKDLEQAKVRFEKEKMVLEGGMFSAQEKNEKLRTSVPSMIENAKKPLLAQIEKLKQNNIVTNSRLEENFNQDRASLNKEIEYLKENISSAESNAKQKSSEISRLEKINEELDGRNLSLEKNKKSLSQKISSFEIQLVRLEESIPAKIELVKEPLIKKINRMRTNATQENTKYQQELEAISKSNSERTEELNRLLNNQRNLSKETNTKLKATILKNKEIVKELSGKTNQLNDLNAEITTLKVNLDSQSQEIPNRIDEAKKPLQNEIKLLQKAMSMGQNENSLKDDQIKLLTESNAELGSLLSQLKAQEKNLLLALERSKEELVVNKATSLEEIKAHSAEMDSKLEQTHSSFERKFAKLESSRNSLLENLKNIESSKAELESKNLQIIKSLNNELSEKKNLSSTLKKLKEKYTSLEKQIPLKVKEAEAPLQKENNLLKKQIAEKSGLLAVKEKNVSALNKESRALDEKIKILLKNNSKLNEENAVIKSNLTRLQGSIPAEIMKSKAPLETEISDLENRIIELEEKNAAKINTIHEHHKMKLAKLNDQLADRDGALKTKIDSIAKVNNKNKTLVNVIEKLRENKLALESDVKNNLREIDELKKDIPGRIQEAKQPLGEKIVFLEKELSQISTDLKTEDARSKTLSLEIARFAKNLKSEKEKKRKLENALLVLKEDYSNIKASIPEEILRAKAPLQKQVVSNAATIDRFRGNLEELKSNNSDLAKMNKDLEKELINGNSRNNDLARKLSIKANELKNLQKEHPLKITKAIQPLQEENLRLNTLLKERNVTVKEKENSIIELSERLKTTNQVLSQEKTKNTSLAKGLASIKGDLDELQSAIPSRISNVKAPLEKTILTLKSENNKNKEEIKNKALAINQLQRDVSSLSKKRNILVKSKEKLNIEVSSLKDTISHLSKKRIDSPDDSQRKRAFGEKHNISRKKTP